MKFAATLADAGTHVMDEMITDNIFFKTKAQRALIMQGKDFRSKIVLKLSLCSYGMTNEWLFCSIAGRL